MLESLILAPAFVYFLFVLGVWSSAWKGVALWKAARNSQLAWFVVIIILNTAGILEMLYIFLFQKKGKIVVKKGRK